MSSTCPVCDVAYDNKNEYALTARDEVKRAHAWDAENVCIYPNYIDAHEFSITVYFHGGDDDE